MESSADHSPAAGPPTAAAATDAISPLQRLAIALIVAGSCVLLAAAAASLLGPAFTGGAMPAAPVDYRVEFRPADAAVQPSRAVHLRAAFVDSRLRMHGNAPMLGESVLAPTPADPGITTDRDQPGSALSFSGRGAVIGLYHADVPMIMSVTQAGAPIVRTTLQRGSVTWHQLPAATKSYGTFFGALALLSAAALLLRPWRGGRRVAGWLLVHTITLQAMHWLTLPIALNNDTWGHLGTAGRLAQLSLTYHPPGYSIALALFMPFGDQLGAAVTLAQGAAGVLTIVWLHRILRRSLGPAAALAGSIGAASLETFLVANHSLMTESFACWASVGTVHFLLRQRDTGLVRYGVAAGLFAAFGGLLRVVPLAIAAVLLVALHLRRPFPLALRRMSVPAAFAFGPVLALMIGTKIVSGNFALANSVGSHVFNSVVAAKRMFDRDGAVSSQYTEVVLGAYDSIAGQTSAMRRLQNDHGLSYDESQDVLLTIALEALAAEPWQFVVRSAEQSWLQFFTAPRMITVPKRDADPPAVTPPLLGISGPGIEWSERQSRREVRLWPWLCWAFLGSCVLAPFCRRPVGLFALAAAVIGLVVAPSLIEYPLHRYSALGAVALVALAVAVPLDVLRRLADRILHLLARRSPPDEDAVPAPDQVTNDS